MNYKQIFPRITKFAMAANIIAVASLLSGKLMAEQTPKLVEAEAVKRWNNGVVNRMHCEVVSPNIELLASHSAARIKWVLPIGSQVVKGQLIAEQDGYYLEQAITQLELEIEQASVEEDFVTQEYRRLLSLNKQSLVSSSQFNNAARLVSQASLSKKLLIQRLEKLQYQQNRLQHFAPVKGEVISMEAQPGQFLVSGQSILKLLPTNNKELVCELPLAQYRQNHQLSNAQFFLNRDDYRTHYNDKSHEPPAASKPNRDLSKLELTLVRQSKTLRTDSQTLSLYLKITPEAAQKVLIGERLQINVNYHTSAITRVPNDALELTDDGYFVWKLNEQNTVNRLPVSIISTQNDYFLVKSDLRGGDYVVTFGKQGLADKQQVVLNEENLQATSL